MLETLRTIALSDLYLLFCMAVMVVPMIVLSIWYHTNINKTEGGRALMREQNAWRLRGGGRNVKDSLETAGDLSKGIHSGRYGDEPYRMQVKVYWFIAMWLLACVFFFGLIVWAEETKQHSATTAKHPTLSPNGDAGIVCDRRCYPV